MISCGFIYARKFDYPLKQTNKLLPRSEKHEDDNKQTWKTEEKLGLFRNNWWKRALALELPIFPEKWSRRKQTD